MLTKRQIEIIKLLNDKDKLTAQNLASSLHVSTKTIRNDIHAINAMYPNSIEAMQASGFKLTNNEIFALIKKTKLNSNNTDIEFLVLKHLMSRTSTYIDDLSDDLFISSTSLLKIIKKINNLLEKQNFNLSIIRKDNKLYLIGSEEEKRKAISFTISHEFTSNVLNINDYANFFQGLNLTLLKQKTIGYLDEKSIKMRDIELISFLLHVAIMIDRIKNKHNVVYDNYNNIDSYFIDLANGYLRLLQQISDVTFNDSEINYLATLFAGKVDINTSKNTDKIKMLIDFMLKDINEMYVANKEGCPRCNHGYRGRLAILEVLVMNEKIKDAITNNAPKHVLRDLVYTGEVVTLLQDGLNKVVEGETSFEEILKIVDLENDMTAYKDDNLVANLKMAQKAHSIKETPQQPTPQVTQQVQQINNQITNNVETVEF